MKRFILVLGLMLLLLVGFSIATDTVTITTNTNSYNPMMSTFQGITMTPNLKSANSNKELEYHWITTDGEFIDVGKEVTNQGDAVLWSATENDRVTEIKNTFHIRLEVIDSKNKKILANTNLTIRFNNEYYEIEK